MTTDLVNHESTNNLVISTLNKAGITTPELPVRGNLPTGTTTTGDVVAAIRTSKNTDPYTDPKVQKLFIATLMQGTGALHETNQQAQAQEQRAVLLEAKPGFHHELARQFADTAKTITGHARLLANYENLDDIRLSSDGPEKVHAAIEVQVAISQMKNIIDARSKVELIDGTITGHGEHNGIFVYANPTIEQRERINTLGPETIWNTARAGVELTMATTSAEVIERAIAYQNEARRIQNERDSA